MCYMYVQIFSKKYIRFNCFFLRFVSINNLAFFTLRDVRAGLNFDKNMRRGANVRGGGMRILR